MAAAPPVARRSRAWIWVLATGSIVVVATAMWLAYGAVSFFVGFAHGTRTCLPDGFPKYPGATLVDQSYGLNDVYPGTTCQVILASNDDVATVTTFYATSVNKGGWQVTSTDNEFNAIIFQPARSASPFGSIQMVAKNGHTEITIDTFTSTCLPYEFPTYPGAKFGGQSYETAATRMCHVVFLSDHSSAAVIAFYVSKLNKGNWVVDSSTAGRIAWRHTYGTGRKTDVSGTVTVEARSDQTEITVDAIS